VALVEELADNADSAPLHRMPELAKIDLAGRGGRNAKMLHQFIWH
jgi:hypothetical protein